MSTVAIVAIGDELLDGRVHESNAYWLGAELLKEGFSLTRTVSCRDQLTEILSTLKFAAEVAEVVIVSGGMGPTSDDLTREAVAKMLQTELVFDQASVNAIEGQLAKRGLTLNETNRRQAFHPRGSVVIPNPGGTAPGFYANTASGKIVCALPGVPSELKALFAASVLPVLQAQFPDRKRLREQGVRLFGIPEAEVGLRIEQLKLPATITVCYRTVFPEIEVLLRIEDRSDADTALDAAIQRVLQAVPEKTIVSRNPKRSLPHVVAEELLRLGRALVLLSRAPQEC